jgi:phosphatidylglycerophosphatase C
LKRGLALFDFDGTVTSRDSLFEIIRFGKNPIVFYAVLIILSPVLALRLVRLISAGVAKETLLRFFFGGMPASVFKSFCETFCAKRLPEILRKEAMVKISEHLALGHRVLVVSASAQDWIEPWCNTVGVECIATRLQVYNDCITGRLASPNCNGEEKVRRILEVLNPTDYGPVYAYGDTAGDRSMMALADFAFFEPFRIS